MPVHGAFVAQAREGPVRRAQGRVMWFVSLPLQVAMYEHAGLSAVSWLGVAVWALRTGDYDLAMIERQLSRTGTPPP